MWKDLFFSLLLHVLALSLMITLALWKQEKRDKTLLRIEVNMVTNKELATLQQRANPVTRPESRSTLSKAKPVKPASILSPQAAPKPAAIPRAATRPLVKPQAAPLPAAKPQLAAELETVLKPEALSETASSPASAPEPMVNPEQRSEPIVKMETAMRPVHTFESSPQAIVRMQRAAKPVLKLKARAEAVVDMQAMPEPVIDLEPRPAPVINVNAGPLPASRPTPVLLPGPMPKPALAAIAKPDIKMKPPPIIKPKSVIDPNYDPFAPLESATDRRRGPVIENIERLDPLRTELSKISGNQLSQKEIDNYIGRMQAAVEKQWRIPVAINSAKNPLVELVLQPNGQIKSLIILESSGNATLNASLIRAIQAAAPFDVPKEQFEYFRVNRIRFHPFK